jgi:hypothetical protein
MMIRKCLRNTIGGKAFIVYLWIVVLFFIYNFLLKYFIIKSSLSQTTINLMTDINRIVFAVMFLYGTPLVFILLVYSVFRLANQQKLR